MTTRAEQMVQKQIGQITYTTQTAYDPLGHIRSIAYPQNGGVVDYAYDGAFNIVSVSDPASGTVYAAFSGYNALGQPGGIDFGTNSNGKDSTTTYTYYPLNHRLQEMTTTPPVPARPVQDMIYGYDDDGNVTSITDNVKQVQDNSQQFTYDGLNRLVVDQPLLFDHLLHLRLDREISPPTAGSVPIPTAARVRTR